MYKLSSLNFDVVERVIIIGHSLGDVDFPYFKEVKERVNGNTEWHVYYYDENDIEIFRDKLTQIGIIEQYINFIHCDTFYDLLLINLFYKNFIMSKLNPHFLINLYSKHVGFFYL
nr:AbiH family protein [Bacillus cereus]